MKTKVIAKITNHQQEWEEPFVLAGKHSKDEMYNSINNLLELYNTHLRPHDTPRQLVGIMSIEIIPETLNF